MTRYRSADEFNAAALAQQVLPPIKATGAYVWQISDIQTARDAQFAGRFLLPARLAESFRTDYALYVAYQYRLAPQRCIDVEWSRSPQDEDGKVLAEVLGPNGVRVDPESLADINGCLANHGVAFGINHTITNEEGTRVAIEHKAWPIEWVRWDALRRTFVTRIDSSIRPDDMQDNFASPGEVPITHGDGRWVVYAKHQIEPWKQEACVLPGALLWSSHAYAKRDLNKASVSHGNAKVVGELPEGIPLSDADGNLTSQASTFLALLQSLVSDESPAGIRPAGSKTEYVVNSSTAWQVWDTLLTIDEKAAARIYLGTDGILGSVGGAPGVDITQLFGVATIIAHGDLTCITRGFQTGVTDVWAAINFGSSALAPRRRYLIPDSDAAARADQNGKNLTAFNAAIKSFRENGFEINQALIDRTARAFQITPPQLASTVTGGEIFAYDQTNGIVTVNEVRERKGLAARPDGDRYIPQALAAMAATASTAALPAEQSDTDGDGLPGEPLPDEMVQALADKMTTLGIARCEHGSVNRCRLCGIERVRDFEQGADGAPVWKIAWRPLKA